MPENPLRFHEPHRHLAAPFGGDAFGRRAESFARFFGTPKFLIGQSLIVVVWIALNAVAAGLRWDPYPFILLNLAFSTQAAYAAPLILLVPTFIVGLYGQNFRHIPELHWGFGYWWSWGWIIAATLAQVVYFRRKGWI